MNIRFAGQQYEHAEVKFKSSGARAYSAVNTVEVYEVGQMHAGEGVSPVPVFLSSDATLLSKKLGGHLILCESARSHQGMYWYV